MSKDKIRINEDIRAREVRLIKQDGSQAGIVLFQEALQAALGIGMDLVEVSPTARPVVCRIMDFGKYKYEQSKRAKEAKKHQKIIIVKEIKLRPKIGEHDYQVKLGKISHFLENPDNKVKVTLMFRGREMAHTDIGRELLNRVVEDLKDSSVLESRLKQEGRNITMVLAPLKEAVKTKKAKEKEEEANAEN